MLPPQELFQDYVEPTVKVGDHTWYSLPLSAMAHGLGVLAVVAVALTAADVLPSPPAMLAFVAPAPPPPPPPAPPAPVNTAPKPVMAASPEAAPVEAPSAIKPETGLIVEPVGANSGIEEGVPGGIPGGVVEGLTMAAPPPPPPPPAAPIRVGGDIHYPIKVRHVDPVYPDMAVSARVQGVVIIEALVGPDGKVKDARVLRSIPVLDRAALDAVRQWEYTPTLLGGKPWPVIMTVTVNFRIQ